jgi:D-glycero-alpha-D-manno-heptose-7-phosphate kinase
MIVAKCPLRISLIGGSTDLQEFINENGRGAVVSFPCNLYTYISLFSDKNGYNHAEGEYIINYTRRESAQDLNKIKNDIAREAIKEFETQNAYGPMSVSFNTDVFSVGSGLASSSSYTVAMVKALYRMTGIHTMDNIEVCARALSIERKFNPLTGYQDTYGCGLGGLKKLEFLKTKEDEVRVVTKIIGEALFENHDCHLIYTGQSRDSTGILNTIDLNRVKELLPLVDEFENALRRERYKDVFRIINEGWKLKKETSKAIASTRNVLELDKKLSTLESVLAHRLCGAGAGGYFLAITEKGTDLSSSIKDFKNISFKIDVDKSGAQVCNIGGKVVIM